MIITFVEEIMVKYGLEKELIENDAVLKDKLSQAKDAQERVFFKFTYSKEIDNYEKQNIPIDIPSVRLREVIEKLIDKKITIDNLPTVIQENLKISPETSKKISEEILNNDEIMNELNSNETIPAEEQKEEPKKTKSIGYELLK
ncbi:MAG: hypothetical protein WA091_02420 [Minisyncoccales bacterium]